MISRFLVVLLLATFSKTWAQLEQDLYDKDLDRFDDDLENPSIFVGKPAKAIWLDEYFDSSALQKLLGELSKKYSSTVRVERIGRSAVDNAPIWAVEITRHAQEKRESLKPMVKLMANMHGDETVGRALAVFLIQYLVYSDGYDDRVSRMLNTTDIWIVPTLNPDGFRRSEPGRCSSLDGFVGRKNGHGIDLNRDFPDQFEDNSRRIYEQETWDIMQFILQHPFVLSGNLHGGAMVASYPYDSSNSPEDYGVASLTSDNAFFEKLALDYARRNPIMTSGTACGNYFPNGITNGNFWYKVSGGMQDFNYVHSNCFEMTMELSCCKYPPAADLPLYWYTNVESLLTFIENTRQGLFGLVTDKKGNPLKDAVIKVKGNNKRITATKDGEYWRLLVPGSYRVTASAPGYDKSSKDVFVTDDEPYVRCDFILESQSDS